MWKALAEVRQNKLGHTPNLTGDRVNVYQVDDTNKLIAYTRFDSQNPGMVVVVANFTGNVETGVTVGFPSTGKWITRFNSDSKAWSPIFSGSGSASVKARAVPFSGMPSSGTLTIGPYSLMILSQN
jgi:1,4-alpha-glucan branching enzyme